jgi:hypothetical protein
MWLADVIRRLALQCTAFQPIRSASLEGFRS